MTRWRRELRNEGTPKEGGGAGEGADRRGDVLARPPQGAKEDASAPKELGIKQENSRIEKRSDLLISTLSGYVEAMLSLVAKDPTLTGIALDKEPVRRSHSPA